MAAHQPPRRVQLRVRREAVQRVLPEPEIAKKRLLSALHTHTKAPCKPDLLWETLRALNRPGRARTGVEGRVGEVLRRPHVLDAGPLGLAPCRVGFHLAGESLSEEAAPSLKCSTEILQRAPP